MRGAACAPGAAPAAPERRLVARAQVALEAGAERGVLPRAPLLRGAERRQRGARVSGPAAALGWGAAGGLVGRLAALGQLRMAVASALAVACDELRRATAFARSLHARRQLSLAVAVLLGVVVVTMVLLCFSV